MSTSEIVSGVRLKTLEEKLQNLPGINMAVIAVQKEPGPLKLRTLPVLDLIPSFKPQVQPQKFEDDVESLYDQQTERASNAFALAIRHGDELNAPEKLPSTLPQTLQQAASSPLNKGIVYIHEDGTEDFQSYFGLLHDAERVLAGLRKFGLKPNDKVIFQFADNREFISSFWGCILGGVIPVPIGISLTYSEINSTINKLVNTWSMLGKPYILASNNLVSSITSLSTLMDIPEPQVIGIEELLTNEPASVLHEGDPENPALMMLTSGSTGAPKGVLLNHKNLISRSAGSVQMNGFSSNDITLNWMALDHVAGIIYFHLRDVFTGCKQIHAVTQMVLEDPLKWIDLIDKYRVTVTFAPNFAFGIVNNREEEIKKKKWDLSSLQFILNGGEAIMAKTARRFMELFIPHGLADTAMHPAWGMSETSSGVVYSNRFSLCNVKNDDSFVEVGAPIPGFSLRITDEMGNILEESKIGHLQVKGLTVTEGYYNNPKANAEAFTEDGWFDTGDLGKLKNGLLTITGRGKDEIIINGVNYYPHEIESTVESIEGVEVSYTAACAVRGTNDDTDKLAIFFHPSNPNSDQQLELISRIRSSIVKEFGIFPYYILPLFKEQIPKTEIGKIQRSKLGKTFGEGGFDHLLGRGAAESGMADTVQDWFYRKIWLPASIDRRSLVAKKGHYLVFMDTIGLGAEIVKILNKINQKCIQIEIGKEFSQLDENKFVISTDEAEHYNRLMDILSEKGITIDTVLHMWAFSKYRPVQNLADLRSAQSLGIYSLLSLIQSLKKNVPHPENMRLIAVSNHVHSVAKGDLQAYEKSTLVGFIKTATIEMPWLRCRHIDFEKTDKDHEYLLDEISHANDEIEIAYRNGQRMKSSLSKIDMVKETPGQVPLKEGGVYLITGGLGGVGSYLAQCLMTRYRAKLILVGRTKLPERSKWDNYRQNGDREGELIKAFEDIETVSSKTNGEFVYYSADVSDFSQIEDVMSKAQRKWDMPLSGLFHLAGDLSPAQHWETSEIHRIDVEKRDAFEAMFQAKVYGTWNLFQLLKEHSDAIFVGFSSVVSELGGATFGAYCAGNSFLNGCCRFNHDNLSQNVYCFNWSMWEEMGMNKENPQFAQQAAFGMGNMTIWPEKGWNSMLAGLCRKDPLILVGLNSFNPHIRSRLDKKPEIPKKLYIYVTTPKGSVLTEDLREQVKKNLQGVKYTYEIVGIDEMPVHEDGSIDLESLQDYGRENATAGVTAVVPQTAAEKKIAEIWQEVLKIKNIGVSGNFFDYGGTSIQLAQVNGRLKEAFEREISMTDLFQYPTISSLAAYLTSSVPDSLTDGLPQSKERGEQRKAKMLSRRSAQRRTNGN